MTFEQAWFRVALAGREMGSGPMVAGERIANLVGVDFVDRVPVVADNVKALQLGITVGLVMAEEPRAMEELDKINKEWMKDQ